jgi:CHAT domain-containing protein
MLSGLLLAPDAEHDGILTALDVFRLRLPADLAVLSACSTGGGRAVAGEGVVGLTRAFLFAGPLRVVVSLWDVDDEATAELMKRFYGAWKAGEPAADALRAAQEHVRSRPDWSHPRYWAAWALWGLPE